MANCIKCGAALREGAKFCGACGAKVEVRRFCTECGEALEPGENFCTQCGTPVDGVSAPAKLKETDPSCFEIEDCDGGCRIKKYTGPEKGDIVIPSRIGGKNVTEIGERAFYCCYGLTSITIPGSVTKIGETAFHSCYSLTGITIPDSVTEIGAWAFEQLKSLTSITIPNSVTEIGKYAFARCSDLTNVTIQNGVTQIGYNAFELCDNRLTIHAPAGSAVERYAKENRIPFQYL